MSLFLRKQKSHPKPKQQPLLYARVGHKVPDPVADAIRVFQRKKGTEIPKNLKLNRN